MTKQVFSLDEKFFDVIDTAEKAYVLGLLFADGNVSDRKDNHYRLRLTLKLEDSDILQKVKECLKFTGTIKVRELKSNTREFTEPYMICELSISNKHLITRLEELGCVSSKSHIIQYPNIPEQFDRDFLRGYFDGNGSVYPRPARPNGFRIEFCTGNPEFLTEIQERVITNVSGVTTGGVKLSKNGKWASWTKDKTQAGKILAWLYKGSTIYLDRKYERACQYVPSISEMV